MGRDPDEDGYNDCCGAGDSGSENANDGNDGNDDNGGNDDNDSYTLPEVVVTAKKGSGFLDSARNDDHDKRHPDSYRRKTDPHNLNSDNLNPKKCIRDCLRENYGVLYDWAKTLSPFSLSSLGNEIYSGYASQKIKEEGLLNIHRAWDIGKRQLKTLAQFGKFSAGMSVLGAGAASFQLAAYSYCYIQCE